MIHPGGYEVAVLCRQSNVCLFVHQERLWQKTFSNTASLPYSYPLLPSSHSKKPTNTCWGFNTSNEIAPAFPGTAPLDTRRDLMAQLLWQDLE